MAVNPNFTVKQQMYRSLSAMRLELNPEIADDIEAKVLAYVDEQQAEIERLRRENQMLNETIAVADEGLKHFMLSVTSQVALKELDQ